MINKFEKVIEYLTKCGMIDMLTVRENQFVTSKAHMIIGERAYVECGISKFDFSKQDIYILHMYGDEMVEEKIDIEYFFESINDGNLYLKVFGFVSGRKLYPIQIIEAEKNVNVVDFDGGGTMELDTDRFNDILTNKNNVLEPMFNPDNKPKFKYVLSEDTLNMKNKKGIDVDKVKYILSELDNNPKYDKSYEKHRKVEYKTVSVEDKCPPNVVSFDGVVIKNESDMDFDYKVLILRMKG